MDRCNLCGTELTEERQGCGVCGYDRNKGKIRSEDYLKTYFQELKTEKRWSEQILFKGKLQSLCNYTVTRLGELLGQQKSIISDDLKLAKGLREYPVLLESKNRTSALRRMKQFSATLVPEQLHDAVEFEEELQNYLWSNWADTSFSEDWALVTKGTTGYGNYPAGNAGVIDLLAKHRSKKRWLVVELKRHQASDTAVGQTLRYMGWVKERLAKEEAEVKGLIICAKVDENLRLAVMHTPIKLMTYRLRNKTLEFVLPSKAEVDDLEHYIKTLSPDDRESLIRKLLDGNSE